MGVKFEIDFIQRGEKCPSITNSSERPFDWLRCIYKCYTLELDKQCLVL